MAGDGNKFHSPKWADRSGNNHHAQLGSAAGADTNDPLGKAYDGDQYVFFPDLTTCRIEDTSPPTSADIAAEEIATLACWYRPRVSSSFQDLYGTWDEAGAGFRQSDGTALRPDVVVDDGTTLLQIDWDGALAIDVWHHLVVTIDHTTAVDLAIFYVNGVAAAAGALDISSLGTITADTISFGERGSGGSPLGGDIRLGEMYKDLATAAEISTVHAGGVGTSLVLDSPVSVVDFADKTMLSEPYATFTDPQSNVFTVIRPATGLVTTVIDRDQWLYSTDDFHEVDDHPALDFGVGEDMTAMVVARLPDVTDGEQGLLVHKQSTMAAIDVGYALQVAGGGAGFVRLGTGSVNLGAQVVGPTDGELFSIAARRTADSEWEGYFDGVGTGSPATDTNADISPTQPFRIGANAQAVPAQFMGGAVVAAALWRRALTDAEIREADGLLTGSVPGAIQIQNA